MIIVENGGTALISFGIEDRAVGKFPQAEIKDSAGAHIAGSPLNLADVGTGRYAATVAAPAPGQYVVTYKTYVTSYGVGLDPDVFDTEEKLLVDDGRAVLDEPKENHLLAGSIAEAITAAAGHAGLHGVLDGGAGTPDIPHNANNNLTSARLRIFASKAAADAAALGAADDADSELLRLNVDVANYNAGSLVAVPQTLRNMTRTSG